MSEHAHNEIDEGLANGIAIVGMSGRFPGASDVETFWKNLCAGVDSIARWEEAAVEGWRAENGQRVKAGGELGDVSGWDAGFFGVGRREAEVMDPQHRLFLECCWEALEAAGIDPARPPGLIGVFGGCGLNSYFLHQLLPEGSALEAVGAYQAVISSDKDALTTQAAYRLDLRGPAVTVQTACSTSLVAVQAACSALWSYQCDAALAGGVAVRVPARSGYVYQEGGILSADGRCRPFSAEANGTVSGGGAGVVALKRYADAVEAGDRVVAVIRGAAVNNDGAAKVGFTAPGLSGQAAVIALALAQAGLEARDIGLVEAHGTGTALGDPVEVAALTQAFGGGVAEGEAAWCALGSVKGNIGHLDAAAGVVGLIKAALAVERGMIPPSLYAERTNPRIDFGRCPFFVNTSLRAWNGGGKPRRAGVSSFGIGGTNAHVVLEEAGEGEGGREKGSEGMRGSESEGGRTELWVVSGKGAEGVRAQGERLDAAVREGGGAERVKLADVAWTLAVGRKALAWRSAKVVPGDGGWLPAVEALEDAKVVFMFPGQGAQYGGMGRGLYEGEAVFRAEVDRCAEVLKGELGFDLREVLYPADRTDQAAPADPAAHAASHGVAERLKQTGVTQPALFVVEYALAKLWQSWGVEPAGMIGHSIGEYVAACLAGVFSLKDALKLVAARGRLMQGLAAGEMMAVPMSEVEVRGMLGEGLSLAAVNAPNSCVVSGNGEAMEAFSAKVAARGFEGRKLHTSHAFHSGMMGPILAEFEERVRAVKRSAPRMKYTSNVTGAWITAEEAVDPAYWARHLRGTVRFADGVATLLGEGKVLALEVGPGRALSSFVRQHPVSASGPAAVTSMRHALEKGEDRAVLLGAAGRLWMRGVELDWAALHRGERRRKVLLPTYAWQRERYWVERGDAGATAGGSAEERPVLTPRTMIGETTIHPAAHAASHEPEGVIAGIWCEVLGLAEVDRDANFFEVGGDSLSGVHMMSLMNQRLGAKVAPAAFFESPTVRSLARQVAAASAAGSVGAAGSAAVADEINEGRERGALRRLRRRGGSGA